MNTTAEKQTKRTAVRAAIGVTGQFSAVGDLAQQGQLSGHGHGCMPHRWAGEAPALLRRRPACDWAGTPPDFRHDAQPDAGLMDHGRPPGAIEAFYRRYNRRCNDHEFDLLGEFVADRVEVNGTAQDLDGYVAGLRAVIEAFPDYRWELRHLLIDGCWISAHFHDTGTHQGTFLDVPATGRKVATQEFALYRLENDKIVEVWVTADDLDLLHQLRR
jgi:predicted ester cyclase